MNFLLYVGAAAQIFFVVAVFGGGSVAGLCFVRWLVPLDRLQKNQQDDGGWPIAWDPPSEAARCEWRGIVTLGALRTLTSYGRLSSSTRA